MNYALGTLELLECFIKVTIPETPSMSTELNSLNLVDEDYFLINPRK